MSEKTEKTKNDKPTVDIDAKLGLDHFEVDKEYAHIVVKPDANDEIFDQLVVACPAGLYRRGPAGERLFDYAGCLECGTCRILGDGTVLERWTNPHPGKGVQYRY